MNVFDVVKVSKRVARGMKDRRPQWAVVKNIDTTTIDIQVGNSATYIRHIPVIGDIETLEIDKVVQIAWWNDRRPVALATGNIDKTIDDITYNGWYPNMQDTRAMAAADVANLEARAFAPIINVEAIHNPGGTLGGWELGAFSLSSGTDTDHVELCTDGDYRIWAGALAAPGAPFWVKRTGEIFASSGAVGGWELHPLEFRASSAEVILNASAAPFITLGALGYDSGSGVWMGKDGGVYKFFVGDASGQKLMWDGTNLNIVGNMSATTGTVGSWVISDAALYSTTAGMAPADYPFYAGAAYADRAAAPFRVTPAGELMASNATIAGTITATNGEIGGWAIGSNYMSAGSMKLTSGDNPAIWIGDTDGYMAGTGAFLGIDNGIPKLHIGDPFGSHIAWDGARLEMSGTIVSSLVSDSAIGSRLVVCPIAGRFPAQVDEADQRIDFGVLVPAGSYVCINARDADGTPQTEYIKVVSVDSGTTYNVERNKPADPGASGYTWPRDTVFMVYGRAGDGRVIIQAGDSRISLLEQTGVYNGSAERVRIGDMSGWGVGTPEPLTGLGFGVGDPVSSLYYTQDTGLVVLGEIHAKSGTIDGLLTIGDTGSINVESSNIVIDRDGIVISSNTIVAPLVFGVRNRNAGAYLYSDTGVTPDPVTAYNLVTSVTAENESGSLGARTVVTVRADGLTEDAYARFLIESYAGHIFTRLFSVFSDGGARIWGGLGVGGSQWLFNAPDYGVISADSHITSGGNISATGNFVVGGCVDLAELSSAPSAPESGVGRLWLSPTGLRFKSSAGRTPDLETNEINIDIHGLYYTGATGTGAIGADNGYTRAMPNGTSNSTAAGSLVFPPSWAGRTMYWDIWWFPNNANAGNVNWEVVGNIMIPGAARTLLGTFVSTAASGDASIPVKTTITLTVPAEAATGAAYNFWVNRRGSVGADTYNYTAHLAALRVRVA